MKILFVGYFHEQSGWGQAAKDYALALSSVGVDVVCRSVRLNNKPVQLDPKLEELLSKSTEGCTICIQNVLPHQMVYDSAYYNIGLWFEEGSHKFSPWSPYLNLMDELWVPNTDMLYYHKYNKVRVVRPPYDFSKIKDYPKLDIQNEGNYTFYFIGEINKRKNLGALLRAFHSEFSSNEPVSLLIKGYRYGVPDNVVNQEINHFCRTVKQELRRYSQPELYTKEIIVTQYLPEHAMFSLHKSCNCLVAPSYGEGWCIPAFDALALGNKVIGTDVGGLHDFLPPESRLPAQIEPCVFNPGVYPGIGNCHESWASISIEELMHAMRFAYTNQNSFYGTRLLHNLEKNYSYNYVGSMMKEILEKV